MLTMPTICGSPAGRSGPTRAAAVTGLLMGVLPGTAAETCSPRRTAARAAARRAAPRWCPTRTPVTARDHPTVRAPNRLARVVSVPVQQFPDGAGQAVVVVHGVVRRRREAQVAEAVEVDRRDLDALPRQRLVERVHPVGRGEDGRR